MRKKIMIIVNIGLETPIKAISLDMTPTPSQYIYKGPTCRCATNWC